MIDMTLHFDHVMVLWWCNFPRIRPAWQKSKSQSVSSVLHRNWARECYQTKLTPKKKKTVTENIASLKKRASKCRSKKHPHRISHSLKSVPKITVAKTVMRKTSWNKMCIKIRFPKMVPKKHMTEKLVPKKIVLQKSCWKKVMPKRSYKEIKVARKREWRSHKEIW